MQAVLREILGYVLFLYLMYSVSYGSKDVSHRTFYSHQQKHLQYGMNYMYGPMKEGPDFNFTQPLPMNKVSMLWVLHIE